MADNEQAKLDIIIELLSKGSGGEEARAQLEKVEKQAAHTEGALHRMGSAGLKAAQDVAQSAPGAGRGLGIAAAAGPEVMAVAAGAGALVGAIAIFDHLAASAAGYSAEIERNSLTVGMNAQEFQGWQRLAEAVGIDQDKLTTSLFRFNNQLTAGAPGLAALRMNLGSFKIENDDTGTSLMKVADYFHTHTDAIQKDAIATALFGRGAGALIPILDQGGEAVRAYFEHLKNMGLILNDDELKTGSLANVIHTDFGDALKAIELQVGSRLEIGFTLLWETISKGLQSSVGGFQIFGTIVGNIVGFLAGFVGQFLGVTVTAEDFKKTMKEMAAVTGAQSEAQQQAARTGETAADTTKRETAALKDAIRAVDDEKRAYDQLVDSKIRDIDASLKQMQIAQQQRDAAKKVGDDQQAIAQDAADLAQARFDGDVAKSQQIGAQMTADKAKLAADQLKITEDQTRNELEAKKSGLQAQKTAEDQAFEDRKVKLQDQLNAVQSTNAEARASTDQMYGGMKASGEDMSKFIDTMLSGDTAKWDQAGKDWAQKIQDFVHTVIGIFTGDEESKKKAEEWGDAIGRAAGEAFVKGVKHALGLGGEDLTPEQAARLAALTGSTPIFNPGGRQHGGSVYAGGTYMVGERGPEPFTPSVSGTISPSGTPVMGGHTINIGPIYGSAHDAEAIAQQVKDTLADLLQEAA